MAGGRGELVGPGGGHAVGGVTYRDVQLTARLGVGILDNSLVGRLNLHEPAGLLEVEAGHRVGFNLERERVRAPAETFPLHQSQSGSWELILEGEGPILDRHLGVLPKTLRPESDCEGGTGPETFDFP